MVLSQLEKLLDIFLPYDMALLKRCLLHLAGDDARDVVTEDTSHSLLDGNLSHWGPSFLVVDGLLPDQRDRMFKLGVNDLQALPDAAHAPWKIDDQGPLAHAGNGPRQHRPGRFGQRVVPHGFGNTGNFLVQNGAGRFGGHIARSDTRPACRENQVDVELVHHSEEGGFNRLHLVGHNTVRCDDVPGSLDDLANRSSALVFAVTVKHTVADSDDSHPQTGAPP